jgi:hypothetical protein
MAEAPRKKYWVKNVKSVSTFPPPGTFTKSGAKIARIMARRSVSPKGYNSAINMVQYFINRAGKKLTIPRKRELETAIDILQHMRDNGTKQPR